MLKIEPGPFCMQSMYSAIRDVGKSLSLSPKSQVFEPEAFMPNPEFEPQVEYKLFFPGKEKGGRESSKFQAESESLKTTTPESSLSQITGAT